MRRQLLVLLGAVLAIGALPVGAVPTPVVASENVELLATLPDVSAISTAFDPNRPVMYVNTLNAISAYDISDPELPLPMGVVPLPHFENEGMSIGVRGETTFLLVGFDTHGVTPTATAGGGLLGPVSADYHFVIVDVTDPAAPQIRGQLDTPTSTHTIHCVGEGCSHAYTSGAYDSTFSVIDLADLDAPKFLHAVQSPVRGGGGSGHQWTPDDAGYLWVAGWGGTVAYDVSDPANPVPVASTDANGTSSPYNDFIQHNVYRPLANNFDADQLGEGGEAIEPSVFNGNIALITEEDYDNPDCQDATGTLGEEGGFSTWHVPYMDADQYLQDNPGLVRNQGKITPLDNWNTELVTGGGPTPAGALCSAHYFTFHQEGFVAQGWYQQGTRILDVRDPHDIKQVGYFFAGASETWHAYWVPERDSEGRVTGESSNIVYTNDVARGIDVLKVTLPETAPEDTAPLVAPILPQWLATPPLTASQASPAFGGVCRLPVAR